MNILRQIEQETRRGFVRYADSLGLRILIFAIRGISLKPQCTDEYIGTYTH